MLYSKDRTRTKIRVWAKRIVVAAGIIILLAGCGFLWIINRPRSCAIEASGASGIRIDQAGIFANFYPIASGQRGPAVLVIGGSEGGLSREAKREAMALQAAGFNAFQIAYHCAPGKPNGITRVPLETFNRALDWLKHRREVDPKALGVIGYSKGAEAALLVASRRQDVRAVAAGMPSSVSWDAAGIMAMVFKGARSSWTEHGVDVPSLPYGSMSSDRGDTYGLHANGLKAVTQHGNTIIPVDRIGGAMLLVCGEQDQVWPSCEMAEQIAAERVDHGLPRPIVLRYPSGGHGVFGVPYQVDDKGARSWGSMGGTPRSNMDARRDAWPKVLAFLRQAFKT